LVSNVRTGRRRESDADTPHDPREVIAVSWISDDDGVLDEEDPGRVVRDADARKVLHPSGDAVLGVQQ
jgi:hypothetical protein